MMIDNIYFLVIALNTLSRKCSGIVPAISLMTFDLRVKNYQNKKKKDKRLTSPFLWK